MTTEQYQAVETFCHKLIDATVDLELMFPSKDKDKENMERRDAFNQAIGALTWHIERFKRQM